MIEQARYSAPGIQQDRLFSTNFVLVCIISLTSFLGFQLLMPTLPLYLKTMGGQDAEIGLTIGIYSVSVLVARFVTGWALDRQGGRWLLGIGAFLNLVALMLYNVTTTVPAVLLLRLFHGLGFGLVTTASWALATELAPPERLGEALGYFGNFSSVALALGPGIALWLISVPGLPLAGFPLLFAFSAIVGALGLLLAPFVRETRHQRKGQANASGPTVRDLLCRGAMPFAIAMLFGSFATGAILTFVPVHLAVQNPGHVSVFFFVYAVVMTISRPPIGILADRVGRHKVAAPLMAVCAAGIGVLGVSAGLPAVLASALICGVGFGSLQPTMVALVVDATDPRERGPALATFMSSVDFGIAVGSTVLGLVAQATGYYSLFLIAAGVVTVGLAYFVVYQRAMG